MSKKSKINSADLQGLTRILVDAIVGVTDIVEKMQQQIVHPPYLPSTPIQHLITGISNISYKGVKLITKFVGGGLDKALEQIQIRLGDKGISFEHKELFLAVLNGVIGDYLEEHKNPLAIPMQFRNKGNAIELNAESIQQAYPKINGKILIMAHGLCMDDIRWARNGHNHGVELANELDYTPIYLRYNTGRHISTNGQDFNVLLEELVNNWPVPIEEIVILAHSMGGLVSRSAFHYGEQAENTWITHLKKIVFLGTPHHGAPLERAGNYIVLLAESMPYLKPFARLGKIRSAGITDLRHGSLLDEDWVGIGRFEEQMDSRTTIPLPQHVACYAVAAIIGEESDDLSIHALGDGLVYIDSALGQHDIAAKNLAFKQDNTWVVHGNNHMDLLDNPIIYAQVRRWLG